MKEKSAEDIEFEAYQIVSNYVMSLHPNGIDFKGLPYQERLESKIREALHATKQEGRNELADAARNISKTAYNAGLREAEKQVKILLEALEKLVTFTEQLCEDINISKHYPSLERANRALKDIGK